MSSAANHRTRSHRSQAKHYDASRRRMNMAVSQQAKKKKPTAFQRLTRLFHRKSAEA